MSVQCKCTARVRNNSNVITHYHLIDDSGNKVIVTSEYLKDALRNKSVSISNLKLTSDGRIVAVQ
jgi:hypothetical protein